MREERLALSLKQLLKKSFLATYLSRKLRARRYRRASRQEAFADIYRKNAWGSGESVSGPGSDLLQTRVVRAVLPELLNRLNVATFLDASCGDFHWMSQIDLGRASYIGADIVPELIAGNQQRYAAPNRQFIHRDITTDPLPQADLVLCRDCLMHLGFAEIAAALRNIHSTGASHFLITTFTGTKRNADIGHGGWWPMNLQLPPFSLPPPLEIYPEDPPDADAKASGKALALWPRVALAGFTAA
jgi:SAM-dependent methyltransferase